MPSSENIGQVNVSVGADYSPLQTAIQSAQGIAATGGKNIADALVAGAASAGNLGQTITDQFNQVAAAAASTGQSLATFDQQIAALVASGSTAAEAVSQVAAAMSSAQAPTATEAEQLNLFSEALNSVPWAEATGQLNMFAESLEPLTATGDAVGGALVQVAAAMEQLQAPIAGDAEQLALFSDALNGIPWAEANGQLNLFTDELEPLAAGITEVTAAATQLATAETEVGAAAGTATPMLNESALTLQQLAQALVAVGAAMVIVNKVEDLGAAALQANDDITRAGISLTVLTGSAGAASVEIDKLEALGQADGLSMPTLLTAATRMQALLGAAAPVPALLAQLANSAAVSGQGIDSVANAFDRLVTSGQASARTLVPLGINLGDLAKAFNDVSGTTLATEANVTSLFKALSEAQKVEVATDALQKLNGIAQQVKEQTFGGEWSALVAQWTLVMADAGKALLPVIDDLIKLTQTEIVPFLKGAIDTFNSLSQPIKDFTVFVGLASIAVVGLAVSLGTLGIAIGGVKTLLGTLGVSWVGNAAGALQVATASGEAATAIEGLGGAATVASGGLAALIAIPVASAIAATVISMGDLQERLTAAHGGVATLTQDYATWLSAQVKAAESAAAIAAAQNKVNESLAAGLITIQQATADTKALGLEADKLASTTVNLGLSIQGWVGNNLLVKNSVKELVDAANEQDIAYKTAKGTYDAMVASMASGLPVYKDHVAVAQDVANALDKLNAASAALIAPTNAVALALANQQAAAAKVSLEYKTALGVYQSVDAAYKAGLATYDQVIAAQEKLATAEQDAASAGAAIPGTLMAVDAAAKSVIASMQQLASGQDIAKASADAQATSLTLLNQDTIVLGQKLVLLTAAQHDAKIAADAGTGSLKDLRDIQEAVVKTSQELQQKQNDLALANIRAQNATAAQRGEVGLLQQALAEANLAVDQAKQKMDAGTGSAAAYASAQKAAAAAVDALNMASADASANVTRSTEAWALDASALAQAKVHLDDVTAAYGKQLASITEVQAAKKSLLDAQIVEDTENAINAAGLQTTTDKYGLLMVAVIEAQVKVDALTKAQQSGQQVADQLRSAVQNLKTAQDALNSTEQQAAEAFPITTQAMDAQEKAAVALGNTLVDVTKKTENLLDAQETMDTFSFTPAGGKAVYALGQAPSFGGNAGAFNDQFQSSALVAPGTSTTVDQLNALITKLDAVAISSGQTGSALTKLESAAQAYYVAHNYTAPTLADLIGQAAATAATGTGTAASGATVSSGGTATSATSSSISSGTLDTAAAGGAYPGVVIHQAAGELLYVTLSGQVGSGNQQIAASSTSDQANATSALAASSTALTVAQAADTMTTLVQALVGLQAQSAALVGSQTNIPGGISTAAAAAQGVPKTFTGTWTDGKRYENGVPVNGTVNGVVFVDGVAQNSQTGQSNSVGTSGNGTAGQGGGYLPTSEDYQAKVAAAQAAAAAAGVPWDGSVPWDGYGNSTVKNIGAVQPVSVPTAGSGSGGGVTMMADFSGANFSGADAASIKDMLTQVLPDMLTRSLRDSGARF